MNHWIDAGDWPIFEAPRDYLGFRMFDRNALALWLDETLEPVLGSAERLEAFRSKFVCEAQQRADDLALLCAFVESGCRHCPLGYRDGTVDALLLHLMIVLDSSFRERLGRLRRVLRQLARDGVVPEVLIGGMVRPSYAHGRRVVPAIPSAMN